MSAFQPEKDRKSVRMLPRFVTLSGKAALDASLHAHAASQHRTPRPHIKHGSSSFRTCIDKLSALLARLRHNASATCRRGCTPGVSFYSEIESAPGWLQGQFLDDPSTLPP